MAFVSHWLKPGLLHVRWLVDTDPVEDSIATHDRLIKELAGPYRALHEAPDGIPSLGAKERRLIADWLEREERGIHAQCRGVAFATQSAIARGMTRRSYGSESGTTRCGSLPRGKRPPDG